MKQRAWLTCALVLALLCGATGQQPAAPPPPMQGDEEIVRVTTNLVQMDVVVTDKDGRQVTDLQASDFELLEDGRPQQITNFAYVNTTTPAPAAVAATTPTVRPARLDMVAPPPRIEPRQTRRTMALVVDDLGTSFESLPPLRDTLRKFVDEMSPDDLGAIIRTGGDVGALQQFTNDKRQLYAAVEHVRWNPCSRQGLHIMRPIRQGPVALGDSLPLCGLGGAGSAENTLNAIRFVLEGMSELPGRKSLVIFTDSLPLHFEEELHDGLIKGPGGGPQTEAAQIDSPGRFTSGSFSEKVKQLARLAVRSSTVIYSIDTRGLQTLAFSAMDDTHGFTQKDFNDARSQRFSELVSGTEGPSSLADQTGGFVVRNSNDLIGGLRLVLEDQKGYYLLGYHPNGETFDRRYHRIKARVKRPGLTVRARRGFFGVDEDKARAARTLTPRDQVLNALMSPFGANAVHVRLTAFFIQRPGAQAAVRALLHVDARDLAFTPEPDGWQRAVVDLSDMIFGDNGTAVSDRQRTQTIRLRGATYERALRNGLVFYFDSPIKKAGAYQFRAAVRDTATGHIGAAGQFVNVPDLGAEHLALSGIVLQGTRASAPASATPAGTLAPALRLTPDQQTPPTPADESDDDSAGPAVRRLRPAAVLDYSYLIYNARLDASTKLPQLTAQVRLFRDGRQVFADAEQPFGATQQFAATGLNAQGRLALSADLPPGDYLFQVVVTDTLAKEPHRTATQWIDFEIVP
ncbi:MAG: VWA domain-containing protein [Pyrinomonadaceae bacterium]